MNAAPASHAQEVLRRFWQIDQALQGAGVRKKGATKFPATSPWWHDTIRRFYLSQKPQCIARVGRRGGKSSTLCRLAVAEALYGQHEIPAGDVGVVAIVSARRGDARARLRTIKQILDTLGVGYAPSPDAPSGDAIDLLDRPIRFQVFTASIAGVSGFTSIFVLLDEVSKWKDKATGANPAAVVIESILPTTATMPEARVVMISSPMGLVDAHADAFAKGDTDEQMVAFAPSWVANPTLTEARCWKLARGNKVAFDREYAAIPQAEDELSLYDGAQVKACKREGPVELPPDDRHTYVATMDPATRGNAWTFAITTLSDNRKRKVALAREWVGSKAKPLKAGEVFAEMAPILKRYRLRVVYSDQFSEDTMRELAAQKGIVLIVDPPWTAATKADAYEGLGTLIREQNVELPPDPQVETDVLGVRQVITRSGLSYDLAKVGPRHSDYAPTIAMGCMLAKVPPKPRPVELSADEIAERARAQFLEGRRKDRELRERRTMNRSTRLSPRLQ